jgi:hypothetical protein
MRRLHLSSIRVRALQPWGIVLALTTAIVAAGPVASPQASIQVGADPAKFVLRGTIVNPDQVLKGEVVIDGDTITCVAADCTDPAGATQITVTNAYIFPGFIDAHNHVAYNFLPKWTPPKVYQRRSQWQASPSYKTFKKPYDENKKTLFCEIVKYGEVKALLSGGHDNPGNVAGQRLRRRAHPQR